MWTGQPFLGAKVALVCGGEIVTYLRDDKPDIPHPGTWDLPGGGREGDEDPIGCGLRETEEEFGLALKPEDVIYLREYPGDGDGRPATYFLALEISPEAVAAIRFGEEGQRWAMMTFEAYLSCDNAAPRLRERFQAFLDWRAGRGA